MANHVHVLLLPLVPPSRLLKSLKGSTAREANRLLGRTGEPFWQRESYDHWVRDEAEWNRIAAYIQNNPVKAGLVARAEEYPWSSARGVAMSGDAWSFYIFDVMCFNPILIFEAGRRLLVSRA
jgi:hypothetical protein